MRREAKFAMHMLTIHGAIQTVCAKMGDLPVSATTEQPVKTACHGDTADKTCFSNLRTFLLWQKQNKVDIKGKVKHNYI